MSNGKNKNIMIIAATAALCLLVATGVFFALQAVVPKDGQPNQQPSANSDTETSTKNRLTEQASTAFRAGEAAFKAGKSEEAVAKFKEAKQLYEKAGETTKAEQLADQVSLAEHAVKVDEGYEAPKAPENPEPSDNANNREFNKTSRER